MKFLTTAALALGMSLSLASAEEVCVCSSTCRMYGDPHVKGMWMNGNYLYKGDNNVVLFADKGFKVTGLVGLGESKRPVKSPFLQTVKVGSKTYHANKCEENRRIGATSHKLNDDTTLVVAVKCSLRNSPHLDVSMKLIQKHCESQDAFKAWAIGHTTGLCTSPTKPNNSGKGVSRECHDEEPTPKPTRNPVPKPPSPKPHKPTSAPTPTPAPSKKKTFAPTGSSKKTSAPTGSSKKTSAPTASSKKTSAPTASSTKTSAPTAASTKTSAPTASSKKTSAPTASLEEETSPPTVPVTPTGGNMTCTIKGDPHAKCFANDDEFQFYPKEENKYVLLYEMPDKLEAIGHVRSFVSSSTNEATDIVDELLIKYNGKWQLQVGYENQCNATLPGAIQNGTFNDEASTSMAPGHSEYTWDEEGLIISWKCAVDEQGSPQGMMVVFNKQVSARDQYKYEEEHNGGICSACDADQPYTGKLPGQE